MHVCTCVCVYVSTTRVDLPETPHFYPLLEEFVLLWTLEGRVSLPCLYRWLDHSVQPTQGILGHCWGFACHIFSLFFFLSQNIDIRDMEMVQWRWLCQIKMGEVCQWVGGKAERSWRQELTHQGEPEAPGERQGQPETPAPQLHAKGSRVFIASLSVWKLCVESLCPDSSPC